MNISAAGKICPSVSGRRPASTHGERSRSGTAAGLVAEVVATERVVERAVAIASVIAAKPALAVRLAKEAVQRAYELPLSEGLNAERKAFALFAASHDRNDGIAAFLEKRPPRFEGR